MAKSIKFGDKDYALVPERLKTMRQENPRAKITTEPTFMPDGSVVFKATIIRDQKDEFSSSAEGHARYDATEIKKPKAFEKLETISVGRALANLGYLNDGQIASTEELEEFYDYKNEQKFEKIAETVAAIAKADTLDTLKKTFFDSELMQEPEIVAAKDKRKKELEAGNANN